MSDLVCNLCGADDYRILYRPGEAQIAQIVQCNRCGLMYANPRGKEADHVEIKDYDPDFVERESEESDRLVKESLQVRDYADSRGFLAEKFPERGRLLEVGSGFGYLLDYFRKDGWDVQGVEPNQGLNRHAEGKLGLNVLPVILPDAKFSGDSFDAALMMHVIEHVPDPLDTLTEIYRVLKPGGMLIMETPRYDTLMFKLLGRRERSLSCGGHIYFFTSKTLQEISEKAGFRVERADKVGRSLSLGRLAFNVGVVSRSNALQSAMTRTVDALNLDNVTMTINLRDMERIYLRKPEAA